MFNKIEKHVSGIASTAATIFIWTFVLVGIGHVFGYIWRSFKSVFENIFGIFTNTEKKEEKMLAQMNHYYKQFGTYCINCNMYVPKLITCVNCGTKFNNNKSLPKQLPIY